MASNYRQRGQKGKKKKDQKKDQKKEQIEEKIEEREKEQKKEGEAEKEALIIGIDFGTTFSGVAWVSYASQSFPLLCSLPTSEALPSILIASLQNAGIH